MESSHRRNRRLVVEFRTKRDPRNNRVINIFAFLYLTAEYLVKPWVLKLNLKSFEVMHGLSRVVMLTPDKLATAIAINKEELPDPDDGGFLIQLVQDLVTFYTSRVANPQQPSTAADVPELEASVEYHRFEEIGGSAHEVEFRYNNSSGTS